MQANNKKKNPQACLQYASKSFFYSLLAVVVIFRKFIRKVTKLYARMKKAKSVHFPSFFLMMHPLVVYFYIKKYVSKKCC
jgi:hypothetical protein